MLSLKVINDTSRSGTHDFLLTFHSNHRPSKIANFSHPRVYIAPPTPLTTELPLELGIGAGVRRN